MQQFFYILACLALPVLWGVIVNWVFDRIEGDRQKDQRPDHDFQI